MSSRPQEVLEAVRRDWIERRKRLRLRSGSGCELIVGKPSAKELTALATNAWLNFDKSKVVLELREVEVSQADQSSWRREDALAHLSVDTAEAEVREA